MCVIWTGEHPSVALRGVHAYEPVGIKLGWLCLLWLLHACQERVDVWRHNESPVHFAEHTDALVLRVDVDRMLEEGRLCCSSHL